MKRLQYVFALVAVLVAGTAAVLLVVRDRPAGVPELPVEIERAPVSVQAPGERIDMPEGGVYAGIVRDAEGTPVEGATVLLVAYDVGKALAAPSGPPPDPDEGFDYANLPTVGFRTAAEGKTDAGGRFSIAAGPASAVRIVAAYRMGYMPALLGVKGPREDLAVRLDAAGQFKGVVIDAETRDPVPGAKVTIYLQQRANVPQTKPGARAGGAPLTRPLSPFAIAQQWVVNTLGSRVWGLETDGSPGLKVLTDNDGAFSFGPVGSEVQLEFVISHPSYQWTEFDKKNGRVVRTVVGPGQTVERTFELVKGKEISGRIVDEETGKGVSDVLIEIEHVSQYAQHSWYRWKKRTARSRSDGSFRVAGLSYGPYTANLIHPSFGREFIPSVPENGKNLRWEVRERGGLEGLVEGLEREKGTVALVLEIVGEAMPDGRQQIFRPTLRPGRKFLVSSIRPGLYRAWVQASGRSSLPQVVEIRGLETASLTFELGGGGRLRLRIFDESGRVVDPAQVQLIRLGENGEPDAGLGVFVTRSGRLDAKGVAPGRYRLRVTSAGFLPTETEPFEVALDEATDIGDIRLDRQAWLRIRDVRVAGDPRAKPGLVTMTVQEEGAEKPRGLPPLTGTPVPIRPGTVVVRASSTTGLSYEGTLEVQGGQTADVEVELR